MRFHLQQAGILLLEAVPGHAERLQFRRELFHQGQDGVLQIGAMRERRHLIALDPPQDVRQDDGHLPPRHGLAIHDHPPGEPGDHQCIERVIGPVPASGEPGPGLQRHVPDAEVLGEAGLDEEGEGGEAEGRQRRAAGSGQRAAGGEAKAIAAGRGQRASLLNLPVHCVVSRGATDAAGSWQRAAGGEAENGGLQKKR